MKSSFILSALGATGALAHGLVTQLLIDGTLYDNFDPNTDPYRNPRPQRIGWTLPNDGPVDGVTTAAIACGTDSTAGSLSAPATAGSSIEFFWNTWPESHRGPTMTYLAKCPGTDCTTADPTTLDWFKIDHAGLNSDGTWISDTIIANNNTRTVTIPSDIAPGPYLIRHELLALHSASNADGAQFYPMCVNLQITGTGSAVPANTVKFPGCYSPTDPGVLLNIYYPPLTSYTIPGPAPYVPGGASAPISSSDTASPAPTKASIGIGSGIPTLVPSAIPPYGNTTRPHGKPPQTTRVVDVPPKEVAGLDKVPPAAVDVAAAVPTAVAPVINTIFETVAITQILTMTVSAVETVTVTLPHPGGSDVPECTPAGRYKRGIYGYGI
ncbi:Lytic polysaccharide monooxygenase [Tuber magnatum]|uniref:lytic cellulose monooxygenase (C4-dehydrogenating) n=1 Tax=Tuber magnatum TaxID=42249 RepID=A0A317T0B7_9PEZI|nr:Lytic polysaccharide monooxygenase [Tuber magnatum]